MRKFLTFVLLGLLAMPAVSWAKEIKAGRGWIKPGLAGNAVAYAKKKNRPVVFLYTFKNSHDSRTTTFMKSKRFNGMVKVLIYADKRPPEPFMTVAGGIVSDAFVPRLYVATPDLVLLAFIKRDTPGSKLTAAVGQAKKIMKWYKGAKKDIKKADGYVEGGKYKAAKKIYKKIIRSDKKYSFAARRTWDDETTPEAIIPTFYPFLDEKMLSMEGLAQKRYETAKKHVEDEEYDEAIELLGPMVADKADYPIISQAGELLKKAKEARKLAADKEKEDKKKKKADGKEDDEGIE